MHWFAGWQAKRAERVARRRAGSDASLSRDRLIALGAARRPETEEERRAAAERQRQTMERMAAANAAMMRHRK